MAINLLRIHYRSSSKTKAAPRGLWRILPAIITFTDGKQSHKKKKKVQSVSEREAIECIVSLSPVYFWKRKNYQKFNLKILERQFTLFQLPLFSRSSQNHVSGKHWLVFLVCLSLINFLHHNRLQVCLWTSRHGLLQKRHYTSDACKTYPTNSLYVWISQTNPPDWRKWSVLHWQIFSQLVRL